MAVLFLYTEEPWSFFGGGFEGGALSRSLWLVTALSFLIYRRAVVIFFLAGGLCLGLWRGFGTELAQPKNKRPSWIAKPLIFLVHQAGFEPTTPAFGERSGCVVGIEINR